MAQNWFKHDYGARNDEKILELRAEYGWKGYGLFFGIIETMCEQETGAIDTDRIGGLCVAYGLPKDELLGFIEYCVEIDLLFEDDDGLIKNKRVIEHLDHMNTLKEAGKKGANKRWKGNKNRGANRGANGTPNADKTREDKIREEKSIHTPPDFEEVKAYFKEKGYDNGLAKKFYSYYQEPMEDRGGRVWKDQNGNTVKSWKQKAIAVWMKDGDKSNPEPKGFELLRKYGSG